MVGVDKLAVRRYVKTFGVGDAEPRPPGSAHGAVS